MHRAILLTWVAAYTLFGESVATFVRDVPNVNVETYGNLYGGAPKRLFLLDNDGTLKGPGGWAPAEKTLLDESLEKLAMNPKNSLWIISARPVSSLKQDFGHVRNLNLAGEYGAVAYEYGRGDDIGIVEEFHLSQLRQIVSDVIKDHGEAYKVESRDNGLKSHLLTYEKDRDIQSLVDAVQNAISGRFPDFIIENYPEKGFANIRHTDALKGSFVAQKLLSNYNSERGDFVVSVGDDTPDEDMHAVSNEGGFLSIIVSTLWERETCAKHRLSSPQQTQELLKYLASIE